MVISTREITLLRGPFSSPQSSQLYLAAFSPMKSLWRS